MLPDAGRRLVFRRSRTREVKNVPFESGIDSVGSARLRLSAKFYLVAMFFVIFDVEALYLFAWSTSIRESGWVGFVEAAILFLCYWQVWFIWCVLARWTGRPRVHAASV